MTFMASRSSGPTTTAGLMLILRESVNAVRGHSFGSNIRGEGWERRNPFRLLKQWAACRRLNKLVAKRWASFECQDYRKRRAAALRGRQS